LSSIHVVWAWFGAGKTHTLHYLRNQLVAPPSESLTEMLPIYTELPKAVRSFLDVYETFIRAIPVEALLEAYLEASTAPGGAPTVARYERMVPNLFTAFRLLTLGSHQEAAIATVWLQRGQLTTTDLRRIGITGRISSTDEAVRILTAIVGIFQSAAVGRGFSGARVIWMIDEFQRIAAGRAASSDVNVGLHALFNACATGLSLVLSFSGPPERKLPEWFSPEIRDRIGATKILILPPLSPADALSFIADVLAHFRTSSPPADVYFPFTEKASRAIIARIGGATELKPRVIMQAFNAVLEAADPLMQAGDMTEIDDAFAVKVLAEYVVVSDAEGDTAERER
jgi:hypothetical protein